MARHSAPQDFCETEEDGHLGVPSEQSVDQSSSAVEDLAGQPHERVDERPVLDLQQRPRGSRPPKPSLCTVRFIGGGWRTCSAEAMSRRLTTWVHRDSPRYSGGNHLWIHSTAIRYPTPCSVRRCFGRAGSSSSLRRRLATKTRR